METSWPITASAMGWVRVAGPDPSREKLCHPLLFESLARVVAAAGVAAESRVVLTARSASPSIVWEIIKNRQRVRISPSIETNMTVRKASILKPSP